MGNVAKQILSILLTFATLFVLFGCGGSGGGEAVSAARVSIDWSARSRGFTGLASAQSVEITIRGGGNLIFKQDRAATPGGYTADYVSPTPVTVGTHQIDLKFFGEQGCAGAVVGTASVAAKVAADGTLQRPDGTPLGSIQTDATVASVEVVAGQTVVAGSSKQLSITAKDSASQVVAVSAGSAFFTISAGATRMELSASGVAQGLAPGDSSIIVTVDGKASAATAVVVTAPEPTVRSFAANANRLAYDPSRSLLYATVPAIDATHPNSLVAFNPTTGAVTNSISLPSEPYELAVSDDFQFAYAALNATGEIVQINLGTFTIERTFPISPVRKDWIGQMKVRPGHPSQLAVSHNIGGGSESAVTLFDSGVALPNGSNPAQALAFGDASTLYVGNFGKMKRYSVDSNGLTQTLSNDNAPGYSYAYLAHAGGRLFVNSYGVLSGTTMSILGTFPNRLKNSLVVPDQSRDYAFGLTWDIQPGRTFQVFRPSNFSKVLEVAIPDVGASTSALVQTGPTSFAFNSAGGAKIYVVENVYLP